GKIQVAGQDHRNAKREVSRTRDPKKGAVVSERIGNSAGVVHGQGVVVETGGQREVDVQVVVELADGDIDIECSRSAAECRELHDVAGIVGGDGQVQGHPDT